MMDLTQIKRVPCRGGEPPLVDKRSGELRPQVPEWEVVEQDGIKCLECVFKFAGFEQSLGFTGKVDELAEAEGHHPAILIEWGRVTVMWWTHKVRGLHRDGFAMAARTDQLYVSEYDVLNRAEG